MLKRKALFALCALSLALFPFPAHSSTNLRVVVKDATTGRGVPAQGNVMFMDPATGRPLMQLFATDASGAATVLLEQDGAWSVMVQAQGYGPNFMELTQQGKTMVVADGRDLVQEVILSPISGVGQIEVSFSGAEPGQMVTAMVEDPQLDGGIEPSQVRAGWFGQADVSGAGKIPIFNIPVAPANAFHLNLTVQGEDGDTPHATRVPIAQEIVAGGSATVTAEVPAVAMCSSSICRFLQMVQEIDFGPNSIRSFRFKPEVRVTSEQLFTRYGEALGLRPREGDSFKEWRNYPGSAGSTIHRYRQYSKGLEVLDAGYIVEEKEGYVQYASNNIILGLNLPTAPVLSEAEALARAEQAIGAPAYPWDVDPINNPPPEGTLAIASKDDAMTKESARLVWVFTIETSEPFGSHDVHIDAATGDVVNVVDNIKRFGKNELWKLAKTAEVPLNQNTASTGKSIQYGQVDFVADLGPDGKSRLASQKDDVVPAPLGTFDARKQLRDAEPFVQLFADGDLEGVSPNNFLDPTDDLGVSVHWGIQQSMAYFRDEFGWLGMDGKGKKLIRAFVMDKLTGQGAGYIKGIGSLLFEKENGLENTVLTVVGHEFTHGVFEAMSSGGYTGENCALQEGFAQLFGNAIAVHTHEKLGINLTELDDWYLALPGYPPTDFFPDTYLGDFYEPPAGLDPCHKNSTIVTHWAWLLEHGGSGTNDLGNAYKVKGIGGPAAREVAFHTMKGLPETAGFPEARNTSIAVAKNDPELAPVTGSVIEAWYAVGVGDKSKALTIPATGATKVEPWPAQLAYEHQPGKTITKFQISKGYTFDDKTTKTNMAGVSYVQPDGKILIPAKDVFNLDPGDSYLWRVCFKGNAPPTGYGPSPSYGGLMLASDDSCDGAWSETHHFWTDNKMVTLVSPGLNNQVHPWGTVFKWKPVAGATAYDLHLRISDFDIVNIPIDPGNPANQEGALVKGAANLKVGQDYEWNVVAKGPPGTAEGKQSEKKGHIKTKTPTSAPSAPANGKTGLHPWGITLKSAKTAAAAGYKFWLAKGPDFITEMNPNLFSPGSAEPPYVKVDISQLDAKGPMYWVVQPYGPPLPDLPNGEWGGKTEPPWSFTVDYKLTKPTLKYPGYFSKIPLNSAMSQFVWAPVPEASKYTLTVYKRPEGDFATPNAPIEKKITLDAKDVAVVDGGIQSKIIAPSTDSDPSTPNVAEGYCWRVEAEPPGGAQYVGLPSDMWCYDLGPDAPALGHPLNADSPVDYNNTQFVWDSKYAPFGYLLWIVRYDYGKPADTFWQFVGPSKSFSKQLLPASEYHWAVSALTDPLPAGFDPTKNAGKLFTSVWQNFTTKSQPSPEPEPTPSLSEAQVPKVACNAKQVQGGSQVDSRNINLGKTSGSFTLTYNTFLFPDQLDVYYDGKKLWSSGCVGTVNATLSTYISLTSAPIPFSGTSSMATVTVTPNCDWLIHDTDWTYTLNCP